MIRKLKHADAFQCAALYGQTNLPTWSFDSFQQTLHLPTTCGYGAFSNPNPNNLNEEGDILGFILYSSCPPEAEILVFVVSPPWQGQGIGTRLLHHVIDEGKYEALFLEVSAKNRKAQDFYKKHGFSKIGGRENYYLIDGEPQDAWTFRLSLSGNYSESPFK